MILSCPDANVVEDSWAVACAKKVLGFALPLTGTGEPNGALLTKNCTVRVGSCNEFAIALLIVDTVAVKLTFCPTAAVVGLTVTEIVVDALPTTMTPVAGPLALKLGSPK